MEAMEIVRFKKLDIWNDSKALAIKIYELTKSFPDYEKYGLAAQMQRAAVSIPSNIAEGSGRSTDKEFAQFIKHARGSLYELLTQIEICYELNYFSEIDKEELLMSYTVVAKKINAFINKLGRNG